MLEKLFNPTIKRKITIWSKPFLLLKFLPTTLLLGKDSPLHLPSLIMPYHVLRRSRSPGVAIDNRPGDDVEKNPPHPFGHRAGAERDLPIPRFASSRSDRCATANGGGAIFCRVIFVETFMRFFRATARLAPACHRISFRGESSAVSRAASTAKAAALLGGFRLLGRFRARESSVGLRGRGFCPRRFTRELVEGRI